MTLLQHCRSRDDYLLALDAEKFSSVRSSKTKENRKCLPVFLLQLLDKGTIELIAHRCEDTFIRTSTVKHELHSCEDITLATPLIRSVRRL